MDSSDRAIPDDGLADLFKDGGDDLFDGPDIPQPAPVTQFIPEMIIAGDHYHAISFQSQNEMASEAELHSWSYPYRRYATITGQPVILVHLLTTHHYFLMVASTWRKLNIAGYRIVSESEPDANIASRQGASRIPRPRNQFILYRQWRSERLQAENAGMTEASISQVVANMWRSERQHVKDHFHNLALEEEALHAATYPGYRHDNGRDLMPQYPLQQRQIEHDPMNIATHLIQSGF